MYLSLSQQIALFQHHSFIPISLFQKIFCNTTEHYKAYLILSEMYNAALTSKSTFSEVLCGFYRHSSTLIFTSWVIIQLVFSFPKDAWSLHRKHAYVIPNRTFIFYEEAHLRCISVAVGCRKK